MTTTDRMPEMGDRLSPESGSSYREIAARGAHGATLKRNGQSSIATGDPGKQPSAFGQIKGLFNAYAPLGYMLPRETLDYVELLSTYNPDFSQAVENLKMLSNSGHELMVEAGSELQVRRIKEKLEEKARTIQAQHGGIDGVIDKLMDQAAVYGAMCGEWILSDDLSDVVDFVDINPKTIYYFWQDDEERFAPYQRVNHAQAKKAKERGQEVINDTYIRLNELTFHYYAFDAAPESPYGTPPFLAALANIAIQRDLVANMAQIVKKIGLLGIIDLKISALDPKPGETDEHYAARAEDYLSQYAELAEDMAREGGLIHFDDVEAKTWQIGGNAAGATNIHKANEEMVFSGLKSMPSVQGRSYSTTETYAGVAYDIIIRNTAKYQRAAKRMIESGYWLVAGLNGMAPTKISLKFNENRSINRQQDAVAESVEIRNSMLLWVLGVIDQLQVSQRHGYGQPATPMTEPPERAAAEANAQVELPEKVGFDFESNPRGGPAMDPEDPGDSGVVPNTDGNMGDITDG